MRLNSWVEGGLWSNLNNINHELRFNLGKVSGEVTDNLSTFKNQYNGLKIDWDLANSLWTTKYNYLFEKKKEKEIIKKFQDRFESIQKSYKKLRKSFIHNDINDNNIIVSSNYLKPKIKAIIDFGDTIRTQTINDLAVTCTYSIMNCENPLSASLDVIKGYNESYRLTEKELYHLYTLIGMRLVISLTKSRINKLKFKENKYLLISEKPALKLINKWYKINENLAYYFFRNSCGFKAHPNEMKFKKWVKTKKLSLAKMFPLISKNQIFKIDLSVESKWVKLFKNFQNLQLFENTINHVQHHNKNKIIGGGYLEDRQLYNTKNYQRISNDGIEKRTIHLGIDFWIKEGNKVVNLFDGIIDIITVDKKPKGYGGLIILKHELKDFSFFTLFGHLDFNRFDYKKGEILKKGDLVGYIGNKNQNGNWVPHLHFQIILSKLGFINDFPGVGYLSEIEVFKSICPNPNLLFK